MADYLRPKTALTTVRGFSLVELIVAIAVFSVIATSLFAAFSLGVRAWKRINESEARAGRLDRAFLQLESGLRGAVPFAEPVLEGSRDGLRFRAVVTRRGETTVADEAWRFEDGYLRCRETGLVSGETRETAALGPLAACSFAYAERDAGGKYSWTESFGTDAGAFPGAVRLTLRFEDGGETVEKLVYVPAGRQY